MCIRDRRPEVSLRGLLDAAGRPDLLPDVPGLDDVVALAETEARYAGYLDREASMAARMTALDDLRIPAGFAFEDVSALSNEARQALARVRPQTLGQASRVQGVRAADVQVLMVLLKRGGVVSRETSPTP